MSSLFAAMVNGATVSTLVTLAVWVGLRLAPRSSLNAATRYAIWWATLVIAILLPLLYLPPALRLPVLSTKSMPGAATGFGVVRSGAPLPGPVSAGIPAHPQVFPGMPRLPLQIADGSWPRWVLRAWAVLAALMLARLLASYLVLERRKRRAVDVPSHLAQQVEDWLVRCGCSRRTVRLAASSEIATPMVAGLGRPSILIPARLIEQLMEDEIGQIGLHEAAHLARRDDYALMVQRVVEAVFVLHPVVRWIGHSLDLEREIACDDFVLNATGQARPYAACLARVVELTGGVQDSLTAAAVSGRRSHLSRRIDMLLDNARHTGTRLLRVRLAAAVAVVAALAGVAGQGPALVAFALPAVTAAAQSSTEQDPPAPVPVAVESPVESPAPQPAPEPAPQPAAPPVRVPVTVQEPMNRYVTGLAKEHFRVIEDGVPQEILNVTSLDLPVSIGILFDTSGSMRARLAEAQRAVAEFLRVANPASQSFLITYNQDAVLAETFTSDSRQILQRLDLVQPNGGTSLREAILLALQQMQVAPYATKVLLIVSDGSPDNASRFTKSQVVDAIRAAQVEVYALSFLTAEANEERRGLSELDENAALTGGGHSVISNGDPPMAAAAGMALRNRYVIEYHPKNAVRDGRYRSLRVEVLTPRGLPPLKTIHPPGYSPTPQAR